MTRLGVPMDIQAFFNISEELSFHYGDTNEHYGKGFHKIPTTVNLWMAGEETALEVIVTYCAMEAIAFITINRQRYPKLEELAFVAIGNKLQEEQANWMVSIIPDSGIPRSQIIGFSGSVLLSSKSISRNNRRESGCIIT